MGNLAKGIRIKCKNIFRDITIFVYTKKYIMLVILLAVTVLLSINLPNIVIDTRDESFFHKNDPAIITYNDFKKQFGQDEVLIIALRPKHGLDKNFFNVLYQLHMEIEKTVPHVEDVKSLINGRIVRGEEDTLYVEKLVNSPPRNDKEVSRIIELIENFPLYEGLLISQDRSMVSIVVKTCTKKSNQSINLLEEFDQNFFLTEDDLRETSLSIQESTETTDTIKTILNKYKNSDLEIYFTGVPVIVNTLQAAVKKDLSIIMPLSFLIVIFFLTILYRRISGVIYPLVIVILSLIASFGFMALVKVPITLISQILPSFLLIVGVADAVHVLTFFYQKFDSCGDKKQSIIDAISNTGFPILITSLTTACGLLSFVLADIAILAQLGYVAPIGILFTFIYTIVLLPILIAILPMKQINKIRKLDIQHSINSIFTWIARVTTRQPLVIISIFVLTMLVAVYNIFSIRFSHNISTWFPEKSDIRIATNMLDSANGGSVMLEVLIDSCEINGLHEPSFIELIDQSVDEISNLNIAGIKAGKVWAFSDVLKEINRALNSNQDEAYSLPKTRELVAQELILFESSESDDMQDFIDSKYQIARLSIIVPFVDANLYSDYIKEVKEHLREKFLDKPVVLTGKMQIFAEIITNTIKSMIKSYATAIIMITLLMIILIGDLRVGLISMAANIIPIIYLLGFMGIKGIPLDLSTVMIGSLILGVVVDDTIHFLHHFQREIEKHVNLEEAIYMTFFTTGRALFITSMVLCGGFFIYTIGYLENNIRFGTISGVAILLALFTDFFLIPALLSVTHKNFLLSHK